MKRLKPFAILKKQFSASKSETYILISGGLTGFFIIFILNAMLGIYSIYGMSNDLTENMMGINLALSAQVALHEQVLAWENILIPGNSSMDFRKNYHDFSVRSEKVQNILFNLKLQSSGEGGLSADIEKLCKMHRKISGEFTGHIVDMENNDFKNIHDIINISKGKEDELLGSLTAIAERIESDGNRRSEYLGRRYIMLAVLSSFVLVTLLVYYGRRIGRRLLKTHNILDRLVNERTKDYVEANISLQKEIDWHKVTEQKLISSRTEIGEKNRLLTVSERKYRHIVEGTKEVIFTLDENWYFKSANDAVKTEFKIGSDTVKGYTLTELIYDDFADATMLRRIITEKLEESRRNNTPVRFNAQIKTPGLIEPMEFRINLEFIEIEGHHEIIGKAARISDDRFSESFISEQCEYRIKNHLFTADDISHRITDNLQKYIDRSAVTTIRIGLREIIINSIEHGNLNISFDEKSEALMNDSYFQFINDRQAHPEYRDKRVRIEYLISPAKAVYRITDQGKGFNHKKFLSGMSDNPDELMLTHGRGISMVKSIFDEVRYNSRGNQVLLVKYLNKENDKVNDETGNDLQREQHYAGLI